jgi:hypothetical protein
MSVTSAKNVPIAMTSTTGTQLYIDPNGALSVSVLLDDLSHVSTEELTAELMRRTSLGKELE